MQSASVGVSLWKLLLSISHVVNWLNWVYFLFCMCDFILSTDEKQNKKSSKTKPSLESTDGLTFAQTHPTCFPSFPPSVVYKPYFFTWSFETTEEEEGTTDWSESGRRSILYISPRPQIVYCSIQRCFFYHPQVSRQQVNAFMTNLVR